MLLAGKFRPFLPLAQPGVLPMDAIDGEAVGGGVIDDPVHVGEVEVSLAGFDHAPVDVDADPGDPGRFDLGQDFVLSQVNIDAVGQRRNGGRRQLGGGVPLGNGRQGQGRQQGDANAQLQLFHGHIIGISGKIATWPGARRLPVQAAFSRVKVKEKANSSSPTTQTAPATVITGDMKWREITRARPPAWSAKISCQGFQCGDE